MANERNRKSKVAGWKLVLGLTGGMGSGKSTVLSLMKEKGAFTQDADLVVRQLLKNKTVLSKVRKKFGSKVFDCADRLDKARLAEEVFSVPRKRKILEAILHPLVRKSIWSALRSRRGDVAVLDIPLLYESRMWERQVDAVLVVDASLATRLKRLKKKGFLMADAKRRIKAQMNLSKKVKRADFVVNNNGSFAQTKKQIDEIWKILLNKTHGGINGHAARP